MDNISKQGIELYEYILKGLEDGYLKSDIYTAVNNWVDKSFWENVEDLLEFEKIVFNKEKNNRIIEDTVRYEKGFFDDIANRIFLKLLVVYEENKKLNGENTDLYYIVDRFGIVPRELRNVLRTYKNCRVNASDAESFIDFIKQNNIYEETIVDYKDAFRYGEEQYELNPDNDNIEYTLRVLNNAIKSNPKEYFYDTVYGDEDFKSALKHEIISIIDFANCYCDLYGMELTDEEYNICKHELSSNELEILNEVLNGLKVKTK